MTVAKQIPVAAYLSPSVLDEEIQSIFLTHWQPAAMRELTEADYRAATPFSSLPPSLQAKLRGRPKAAVVKERSIIRLSPDVVKSFRDMGDGWQTRVDETMVDWLKQHKPASM